MQAIKLTWDDLLIQNADPAEVAECLAQWSFVMQGEVAPIFLNRFGSWFLQRRDGRVQFLDVLDGTVQDIANSYEEFTRLVNSRPWQEDYLMSRQVFALHQAGLIAAGSECYTVPHPHFGFPDPRVEGELDPRTAQVASLPVWQSLCRQALGGPP